jgi:hypothetical protein
VLLLKFILNISNATNVPQSGVYNKPLINFCTNTIKLCYILELLVSQISKAMKSSYMVCCIDKIKCASSFVNDDHHLIFRIVSSSFHCVACLSV